MGHGQINNEIAVHDKMKYHNAGFASWDLAEIYRPDEDFIGAFMLEIWNLKGKQELAAFKY